MAGALTLTRLARGRRRRPPLRAPETPPTGSVSAIVPARNEAQRIGPCLRGLLTDPVLDEVLVVDDGSSDATAAIATALGARVLAAGEPPAGWTGKPWALQRGLQTARGEIVVCVDADTRPRPGLAAALVAALQGSDLVSAGARFSCDTAAERWLHPALLATLVYRFGPPDTAQPPSPHRIVISGQCTAARRQQLLDAGGYRAASGYFSDDVALARALAQQGWTIAFHDGGELISVDMHDSARDAWREWGRTIALQDVTSPAWLVADLAAIWLVLGLPLLRLAARRARRLDLELLTLRLLITAAMAPSYVRRGPAYWLSPMADPLAALRITLSTLRPPRAWRGRVYPFSPGDGSADRPPRASAHAVAPA